MAFSRPNNIPALALLLLAGFAMAQESETGRRVVEELELDRSLPINLDAESSEFDRQRDTLSFTGLHINQGGLDIKADEAQASRLDFEDTVWTFSGNVHIRNSSTRIWSDSAEIAFLDHQVDSAVLSGGPARFEQQRPDDENLTQGSSAVMDYNLRTGVIRMAGDAWISDGANEVSGPRIAYDVNRDLIKADGEEGGQVRMKIIPPADKELKAP